MGVRRSTAPTRTARRPGRLLALGAAALIVLAGCTTDGTPSAIAVEPPHRLTAEQAGQLAGIRFVNHSTGTRGVRIHIPAAAGQPALEVVGYYDFAQHLGYAKVDQIQDGTRSVLGLVSWTPATIGVADATRDDLPLPIPDEATPLTPLDPATSTLNTMLAVITNLGADQPENAELLEQSDALWLRAELLGGVPVAVYAGPSADREVGASAPSADPPPDGSPTEGPTDATVSTAEPVPALDDRPLEYWVTSVGELRRVQKVVDTGDGSTGVAVIDFLAADGVSLVEPTASGPAGGSTETAPSDVPSTEVPSTEVPSAEVPSAEVPSAEVPSAEVPFSEVPFSDAPFTDALPPDEAFPGGQPADPLFGDALPTGTVPADPFPSDSFPAELPPDQEGAG